MTDIHQSPNYAKYMESLGWIVEGGTFIKKLWFTSLVKIQRPTAINLEILKKYHPFLIKLEPLTEINISGFKKDSWPLLPTKTLILDLKKINLPKDTRYEIRKAERANVRVEPCQDVELFYKMLQETMKIGHWSVPIRHEVTNLYRSFQPSGSTLLLSYSPAFLLPIAGCLLIWHGDTAHYMYAANTAAGRKLGAAYLTLWEAIKFCQKKRLKYLDLEGIYDDRYSSQTKRWQGFTKFKLGWGGKIVEYPGSFSRYIIF
ncbi:MAG: peptidoglycan bridge formation glycyltransferase FemA/FemB family protein [Patescibacteria group bacterium]|nr:peptidoglycan bridge formation glycyltransferase FemA/FemB family protein [Patescibacteria group bacterium]MCL5432435.1 peptidoglycan bridge formation glycyltransferase FemA/FemB family protein [Patescibacteria group bacterium]